jgi:hypothetical protein
LHLHFGRHEEERIAPAKTARDSATGNASHGGHGACCTPFFARPDQQEATMQTLQEMLSTTPNRTMTGESVLDECIEACAECELACTVCADACLGERQLEQLRACIRLNQDCADACNVTARVLSRQLQGDMEFLGAELEACALGACSHEDVRRLATAS